MEDTVIPEKKHSAIQAFMILMTVTHLRYHAVKVSQAFLGKQCEQFLSVPLAPIMMVFFAHLRQVSLPFSLYVCSTDVHRHSLQQRTTAQNNPVKWRNYKGAGGGLSTPEQSWGALQIVQI
jgi:hypothetical protein